MKIGIFGGSFNPPHKMHISMCNALIENNYVDKIIFVPTGTKYKYKNNLISNKDRYNMLKLITNKNPKFDVSNFELKNHVVYTYQTLDYFKNKYKENEIYFICGLDNLSYLDKWEKGEYILSNYKILVVNRSIDNLNNVMNKLDKYKDNIILTDDSIFKTSDIKDISSTIIRKYLKDKKDVESYLEDYIIEYIKKEGLYESIN